VHREQTSYQSYAVSLKNIVLCGWMDGWIDEKAVLKTVSSPLIYKNIICYQFVYETLYLRSLLMNMQKEESPNSSSLKSEQNKTSFQWMSCHNQQS
jgi:hypothetical protein